MKLRKPRLKVRVVLVLLPLVFFAETALADRVVLLKERLAGEGIVEQKRYGSVQAAIDAAGEGDEVVLSPGRYRENVDFKGKSITLRSEDPDNDEMIASTVIDGGGAAPAVAFEQQEPRDCVLLGITVTNGGGASRQVSFVRGKEKANAGGGVLIIGSCPTIRNCCITGNRATYGAGIAILQGSPLIEDCLVADNDAGEWGGGICSLQESSPKVTRCRIMHNRARSGGGISSEKSDFRMERSLVCRNFAEWHNGAISYHGKMQATNCTIAYNKAGASIGGAHAARWVPLPFPFVNCIFWENGDINLCNCTATHSCVQTAGQGSRNFHSYPYFVDPEKDDYRLQPWSPCIGAGKEGVTVGAHTEATVERPLDTDNDQLPDMWEKIYSNSLLTLGEGDSDADGVDDLHEYLQGWHPLGPCKLIYVRADADEQRANGTQEHPFPRIEQAVHSAAPGAEIRVAVGRYPENVEVVRKGLTISGGWEKDWSERSTLSIDSQTVIDGQGKAACLRLLGLRTRYQLTGLTLTGGKDTFGGGLYVCGLETQTTISECRIWGNKAAFGAGVGVWETSILLLNCVIAHNEAWSEPGVESANKGGGVFANWGKLSLMNCTLVGNSATFGGAIYRGGGKGELVNCILWKNQGRWGREIALEVWKRGAPSTLSIHHSVLQGGIKNVLARKGCSAEAGEWVISVSPWFVDQDGADGNPTEAGDNDYRIRLDSPCVDTGDCCAAPLRGAAGNLRGEGEGADRRNCDIGAFEAIE